MAHATLLGFPLHGLIIVYTIKNVEITFDPDKDAANLQKHGLSLSRAVELAWETALVWDDDRCYYGEPRQAALALLGTRVHFVVFVDRADSRRVISLRRANLREAKRYVQTIKD